MHSDLAHLLGSPSRTSLCQHHPRMDVSDGTNGFGCTQVRIWNFIPMTLTDVGRLAGERGHGAASIEKRSYLTCVAATSLKKLTVSVPRAEQHPQPCSAISFGIFDRSTWGEFKTGEGIDSSLTVHADSRGAVAYLWTQPIRCFGEHQSLSLLLFSIR